ncbi:hypothetical protein KIH31_08495 [Paenarthrobacter sp. DKR-5]|uniref:hypothetical protein n=1 Tax=Paenarthrobacter sp. DKR-5 TaxID=2835535 RepID=UPI001BDBC727|nr:hypothetical protein [Paenarthrobacter sp. DKR-5]MBT1002640.1 hypothetical protein [Paenarthrobacter sp. DKR-5]
MTTTPTEDPDAIIASAEQEAQEAAQLVETLEGKVRSGDDTVTHEEISNARRLLDFVRLRREGAAVKAAKAREQARRQACEALKAEIDAHTAGEGEVLAQHLGGALDSLRAFVAAVNEHNERVYGWRARAEELGVPVHLHPTTPPAEHGRLGLAKNGYTGWTGAGIIAGRRQIDNLDANHFISRAFELLRAEGLFRPVEGVQAGDLLADVANVDFDRAPADGALFFYRNQETGAVFRFDKPKDQDFLTRGNLVAISRQEAWGE